MVGESAVSRLAASIREQGEACGRLGSPLYAELLTALAADVLAGGPGAAVLAGHEDVPQDSAVAVRLMGGVHRLVLERRAPTLAAYYPSVGGTASAAAAWPAFRDVLVEHRDYLRLQLRNAPQTNEVGRSAALIGGLLHVAAWHQAPVRLFEIGASAGLNLCADHFRIELGDGRGVGPADAAVVLTDPWAGVVPPLDADVSIVEREGCDVEPLDAATAAGRLALMSYVWPDQQERLARLRGALEVAAHVPARVHGCGAAEFVRQLDLRAGTTTVLWHSVMWQYLPHDEQAAVVQELRRLAAEASNEARLAHLQFEPDAAAERDPDFVVRLRTWPGDHERVLAHGHPHGFPLTWR